MRILKRIAIVALGLVALCYAGLLLFLFTTQRSLIFPAPTPKEIRPPPGGRVIALADPSGPAYALFVPPPPGGVTLVLFHGNGQQVADDTQEVEHYRALGVGIYAIEYPGYGPAKDQAPSEGKIYAQAEALLRDLTGTSPGELAVPRDRLVLVGRSLGSGVAVEMARRGWGTRLVLLSAYTSIPDAAANGYPFVPTHLLIRDVFDTLAKAPQIQMPVLLIHGDRDDVVPYQMGQRLSGAFPHAKLLTLEGLGHNGLFDQRPDLYGRIVDFAEGR